MGRLWAFEFSIAAICHDLGRSSVNAWYGRILAARHDCTNDRCTLLAAVDFALGRGSGVGRVQPVAVVRQRHGTARSLMVQHF